MHRTKIKANEAREQLAILGLAFRIDKLDLSEAVYLDITVRAAALAKHIHHVEPEPKGCAVFIDEMEWAPDLGGWVHGHEKVEQPYWFPKLLLTDLRDLLNDLDDLALHGRYPSGAFR